MNRTAIQRVLGATAGASLALAVERLVNAAMQRSAAGAKIALTFSLVFGLTGVVLIVGMLVLRYLPGRSRPVRSDRRSAIGSGDRDAGR